MADDPVLQLRVFNLNCWGIRYLSKRRQERVRLLGDTLRREPFDLVLLQEVWSEQDYALLQEKLGKCCPFSHYFRSGVIGSGLCVFSKFPILDTFLHQYSLNGYPYMLWHGDWFCGKSVGLVVLQIDGIVFNVYVTHLHAEYCRDKDTYLPHRLVQTWELAQFIRHTSQAADVVLLGGDLNTQPQDLGMRLLRGCTGLRDAFAEAERFEGCKDGCTLVPSNCFTVKTELRPFPLGIRIDYILYKAVSNVAVTCKELWTTTGTAPGRDIPYSDHEAVMATLCVRRQQRPRGAETDPAVVAAATSLHPGLGEVPWDLYPPHVPAPRVLLGISVAVQAAGGSRRAQCCSSLSRLSSCTWMRALRWFTTSSSRASVSCSAARSAGVFCTSVGATGLEQWGRRPGPLPSPIPHRDPYPPCS
uniref:Sphingomyelin phosphodiesterase 2 n=1 Tax=Nothoprocta perdicaria TaxID=30464 RepID=A0A8C6Z305_NOTPE